MSKPILPNIKFLLILFFISNISYAEPFDSTGLIDLKNEGTLRGTCYTVGLFVQTATSQIYVQLTSKPIQDRDLQWKRQQDAKAILDLGKNANYWAKALRNGVRQHVPPSQMEDFTSAYVPTANRLRNAIAQDPKIGIQAWLYCGKIYGFL